MDYNGEGSSKTLKGYATAWERGNKYKILKTYINLFISTPDQNSLFYSSSIPNSDRKEIYTGI